MNCGEVKKIIQLYLDDELSSRETLEAQNHLESCLSCSALLESFARQDELLRQAARSEESNGQALRSKILTAIGEQFVTNSAGRLPASKWNRFILAAAAMIIIAIGLLWGISLPGLNDKVYAEAVQDHTHHCALDRLEQFNAIKDRVELDRLCAQYGQLPQTPDLTGFGFSEPRAKVCALSGVRTLHLVYQSAGGQPMSIFMRSHSPDLDEDMSSSSKDGFRVASVTHSGVDILIVANLDSEKLEDIAQSIMRNM